MSVLYFFLAWTIAACMFGLILGPLIGGSNKNDRYRP